MPRGHMHLDVFAVGTGNHIAGWRHPGAFKSGDDLQAFVEIAQSAERGKLDMFFIADGVKCSTDAHPGFMSQLEPLSTLAAVSMVTTHIGLVATASTTFCEPLQSRTNPRLSRSHQRWTGWVEYRDHLRSRLR